MNGPLAQLVALALHGQGVVAGGTSVDFLASNSTAQFCESITFVHVERAWFGLGASSEVRVADTPNAWFAKLEKNRPEQFSVRWAAANDAGIADRMLAGLSGGGGNWTLVIRFPDSRCEHWLARWDIGDRNRADRRIWRVTYLRVAADRAPPWPAMALAAAAQRMKTALLDIRAFSARQKADPFTQHFERGLSALAHEAGAAPYHRDLIAGNAPREAADVLDACQHAWVFGGMGSWNDLGFNGADQEEYDRVSEQLYQAIMAAIPAAVDACTARR